MITSGVPAGPATTRVSQSPASRPWFFSRRKPVLPASASLKAGLPVTERVSTEDGYALMSCPERLATMIWSTMPPPESKIGPTRASIAAWLESLTAIADTRVATVSAVASRCTIWSSTNWSVARSSAAT